MPSKTLADFTLSRTERATPLWKRLMAVVEGELEMQRSQNDAPAKIDETTLRRGEIRCLKRILALSDEGGPGAGASDAYGAESQTGAPAGADDQ